MKAMTKTCSVRISMLQQGHDHCAFTERERERGRERHNQTDRQTGRQRDRETETVGREREIMKAMTKTYRVRISMLQQEHAHCAFRERERERDRQTDRQTEHYLESKHWGAAGATPRCAVFVLSVLTDSRTCRSTAVS